MSLKDVNDFNALAALANALPPPPRAAEIDRLEGEALQACAALCGLLADYLGNDARKIDAVLKLAAPAIQTEAAFLIARYAKAYEDGREAQVKAAVRKRLAAERGEFPN